MVRGSGRESGGTVDASTLLDMTAVSPNEVSDTRYLIRPNRSMDRRQAAWVVMAIATASFAVAGSMSIAYGAWPILPFAGLEVAALAFVIWRVQASSENEDVLVFASAHVDVTRRHEGDVHSYRFNRHWVRVNLRNSIARNLPSRLEIGSHGKFVEIGSFLTDEERASLAEHLTARLTGVPVDESSWKSNGEPAR
jgi:uncharacterized membrane protein